MSGIKTRMKASDIIAEQEAEYLRALAHDQMLELAENSNEYEESLINQASEPDPELESEPEPEPSQLSPASLRAARIQYFSNFENKPPKCDEKCNAITKRGTRCSKKSMLNSRYCHIHNR